MAREPHSPGAVAPTAHAQPPHGPGAGVSLDTPPPPTAGPSDTFKCKDGWIYAMTIGQPLFVRWCKLMGDESLAADPRFKDDLARGDNGEALSAIMQRYGRRVGFAIGALGGAAGGAIGAYGLLTQNFWLFVIAALFTGIYMSAQGFYRFAAADTASESYRPKAISMVMAGGLLSAVVGPQLVKATSQALVVPFLGSYLAVIALNLLGMFLFAALKSPRPAPRIIAPTRSLLSRARRRARWPGWQACR